MLKTEFFQSQLEGFASQLRPQGRRFVSVLQVAQALESKVCVKFETTQSSSSACLDLAKCPHTVFLNRRAPTKGLRFLSLDDEHLLTPRERFSVAHELGHLVAFRELNMLPAREKSMYWTQEAWMNRFAATLLIPDILLQEWLGTVQADQPVSPFCLRRWASEEAKLSEEVVASQLCLRRPSIGFLKVQPVMRKRDDHRVLRVSFSASGGAISLPKTHSHVDDEQLLLKLEAETSGNSTTDGNSAVSPTGLPLRVAWRRGGLTPTHHPNAQQESGPHTGAFWWISAAALTAEPQSQLNFW